MVEVLATRNNLVRDLLVPDGRAWELSEWRTKVNSFASSGDSMLVELRLEMGAAGDDASKGTTASSFFIICLNPSASLEN